MGQVYLAEQQSLRRKVALKVLRVDLAASPTALARFKIEAEAVARATHANIVQVYAIGEAEGLHYMALEYVEGRTLRDYMEKKGSPEVLVALSIIRQVAAALQRASELGIIHRDIKPDNILLTRKGEAKVADFGLSRIFAEDRVSPSLTQSHITMGTPLYMSPEQAENKNVDPRSDIYSFGVTCYHMLAGHPPFAGQTAFEVVLQHIQKEPAPLGRVRPDLPAELCALVHRMMAKRPEDRPQTGREIVKEASRLRDALVGVIGPRSASVVATGTAAPTPTDTVRTQPVAVAHGRRHWPLALALSLAGAVAVGSLLGWLNRRTTVAGQPATAEAPNPPPRADKKNEEVLRSGWQLYASAKDSGSDRKGANFAVELELLYLKERRLDEAEQFARELVKDGRPIYRLVGVLSEGMVQAFRDRPQESNKYFLRVIEPKQENRQAHGFWLFWKNHPALAEMLAEAVNYNYVNSPNAFPAVLNPLRFPPTPAPLTEAKK
jgi:serine/threonine-protein kinase